MHAPLTKIIALCCLILAAATPRASAQADPASEIEISIVSAGAGGMLRAGDWGGIQLQLQDRGTAQREVVLRCSVTDMDGDTAHYDRVVSSNPGIAQRFWIYAWFPFSGVGSALEIRAYEAIEPSGSQSGQLAYRPGRLLGTQSIYNPGFIEPTVGLAAVIGTSQLGLDRYGTSVQGVPWRPKAHELIRTAGGLETDSIPDRWQGLTAFDTVVWGSATLREHDPSTLTPERARALTEWINRGGHLVIVIPSADDPWFRGGHPLRAILPECAPVRAEGVDLKTIRPVLTESLDLPLPRNTTLHTFRIESGTDPQLAVPILQTPDARPLVVQRLVGQGAVTVIGIDLNNGELRRLALPEAEPLWHRILGQRGATPSTDQLTDQERADARQRTELRFDTTIVGDIAKTGRAVQGVLFGLLVFALYWVVAGPVGFLVLKWRKKQQHAWVAFVLVIGAFTALSWAGASVMRPTKVSVKHLTIYDEVHGQPTTRARSWMSVMLPSYGTSDIAIGDPSLDNPDLLAPWEPSRFTGSLVSGFPDNTGYRIESRDPRGLSVPSRATVKYLRADWRGDPEWSGIRPAGLSSDDPVRIEGSVAIGNLTHDLPAPLTDITIFVIRRQIPVRQPGTRLGRGLISMASVWSPSGEWGPGTILDLETQTKPSAGNLGDAVQFLEGAVRDGIEPLSVQGTGGDLVERLLAARLISVLEPPNYSVNNIGTGNRLATRNELHGYDLGRWFTRPCIIITGMLDIDEDAQDGIPFPVEVNDRTPDASGQTLYTWVYPLDPIPPSYPWLAPPTNTHGVSADADD